MTELILAFILGGIAMRGVAYVQALLERRRAAKFWRDMAKAIESVKRERSDLQ